MLPQKLFEIRKKRKMSQESLAEKIGVSRQAIQKWEAGTSRPDSENLLSLSLIHISMYVKVRGAALPDSPFESHRVSLDIADGVFRRETVFTAQMGTLRVACLLYTSRCV